VGEVIGVLGAGSWGTALAVHLARAGREVRLWCRREELARQLIGARANQPYLPDVPLPEGLEPVAKLERLDGCETVLVVVPSHGFREVVRRFLARLGDGPPLTLVSATKGIESDSLERMSQVTAAEADLAGREVEFAVVSGPTFAAELAAGVPSAAVVAAAGEGVARRLQELMSTATFRLYRSDDVVGVELGGAAKNVIAIAAGVATGLGLGHNTLAALITRGLHEIVRLGVASGGRAQTFSGLAGLGDLVLTCTGGLSRNRRTGMELAAGKSLDEIQRSTSMVAEGVRNSASITRLASRLGIELPITEQMMGIIEGGTSPQEAIHALMTRALKAEAEL
jgi:glycerol-3-phosphate dehydrogenase (NAD(P)+)